MVSEQETTNNQDSQAENRPVSGLEEENEKIVKLFGVPFARDKKEAAFAIIVIITLFVNTIYILSQYITGR